MLLAVAWGCDRTAMSCEGLMEAGRYDEAAAKCESAWRASGDPADAGRAARAMRSLGDLDRLSALSQRVGGELPDVELERGLTLLAAHRWEEAVDALRTAASLFDRNRDPAAAANAHYQLSVGLWELDRHRESLEATLTSIERAREVGDARSEARSLIGLSVDLFQVGDLAGSARAIALARRRLTVNDDLLLFVLHQEARLRDAEGHPRLARELYLEALRHTHEAGRFRRSIHVNLAEVSLDLDDLDGARKHLREARANVEPDGSRQAGLLLTEARLAAAAGEPEAAMRCLDQALEEEPVPELAWLVHRLLAQLEARTGDIARARVSYQRAIAVVEQLRADLGFADLKHWLLEEKRAPYEELFALEAEAGSAAAALDVFERAHARAFLDAFVDAPAPALATRSVEPTLREITEDVKDRADAVELLGRVLRTTGVATPMTAGELRTPLSADFVVGYLVTSAGVWRVAVGSGREAVEKVGRAEELRRMVDAFLLDSEQPEPAEELARVLLPQRLPPPGTTLTLVVDGVLAELPFAALVVDGQRLIERHPLTYVPSATALVRLRERQAALTKGTLVIADPLGDLAGARSEAAEIGRLFRVDPLIGDAAELTALRERLPADYLHLATHTGVGLNGAWIQLAAERVEPARLLEGRAAPRVAMLATCASARGREAGVWGSVAAAFLAGGTPSVIGSLWSVGDSAALEFVRAFHQDRGLDDPIAAVASAQRKLLAAGRPLEEWAPFVHFGPGG